MSLARQAWPARPFVVWYNATYCTIHLQNSASTISRPPGMRQYWDQIVQVRKLKIDTKGQNIKKYNKRNSLPNDFIIHFWGVKTNTISGKWRFTDSNVMSNTIKLIPGIKLTLVTVFIVDNVPTLYIEAVTCVN